jgi:low affinity Fe/Cu permease
MSIDRIFANFANKTAKAAGAPWTFGACLAVVAAWAVTGPIFKFSQTWQLVINTGTTIITFLMVFLIQNTQNRDNAALQAKLDDLILTSDAENEFVGIETMTDKELEALRARCAARAKAHHHAHQRVEKEVERRTAKGQGVSRPKTADAPRRATSRKVGGRKAA